MLVANSRHCSRTLSIGVWVYNTLVADDQGKEEKKFEFTREGEAVGYISLDQARVPAVRYPPSVSLAIVMLMALACTVERP